MSTCIAWLRKLGKLNPAISRHKLNGKAPMRRWLKSRHGKEFHFLDGVVLRSATQRLARHRTNVFAG